MSLFFIEVKSIPIPAIFHIQSHKNFTLYSCPFSSTQIFDDTNTLSLDQHDCLENNDLITHKKTTVRTPHLYDRSLIGVVETRVTAFPSVDN